MTFATTPPPLSSAQILHAFQTLWGYAQFRPPQGEVIQALLARRDALIVMPTGGGKSICFQLPALLQEGVTLVISPLVALMENQVQELQQRRLAAAVLHSEQSQAHRRQVLLGLEQQRVRLLYLSPETLLSEAVWSRLQRPQLRLNGLIVDEAHCLVQWGETFRPVYERLGAVRPSLLRDRPPGTQLPIAAFTATANPADQQYIAQTLRLEEPYQLQLSPYRPQLSLQTRTIWTAQGRDRQLQAFLHHQGRTSGLVYVRSRATSETLAQRLQTQGYRVMAYHAGLRTDQRRQIEADWLGDRLQFVICTSAFGMGINKPDVRWVVHYHAPSSLAEYVQEIGRAGRDGRRAIALTLVSEPTGWLDPDSRQRQQHFSHQTRIQQQKAAAWARQLPPQGDVRELARRPDFDAASLGWLHRQGRLEWLDPFCYQLRDRPQPTDFTHDRAATLERYWYIRSCRWAFILREFGLSLDANEASRCLCENCHRQRPRSS